MAKKKSKNTVKTPRKGFAEALGFKNIFNNERTDFILGLLLFVASVLVTIAMVSYLTTGKGDQSLLENLRPGEWLNTDRQFQNYCGSFGAITSHVLMTLNFGLAAFAIPLDDGHLQGESLEMVSGTGGDDDLEQCSNV